MSVPPVVRSTFFRSAAAGSHHFVTANGTMLEMAEGIPRRPHRGKSALTKCCNPTWRLARSDSGASGMEHSSTRHGAQPTATNRPVPPTLEDISNFVAEAVRDNTFSRIMELVEGSQYHRNDLSKQKLPQTRLGLVQVEDGYWLCCRYCIRKQKCHSPTSIPDPPPEPQAAPPPLPPKPVEAVLPPCHPSPPP